MRDKLSDTEGGVSSLINESTSPSGIVPNVNDSLGSPKINTLTIRDLGTQPYLDVWQAMSRFTDERDDNTVDEVWLVEHEPVYTQGQAGKPEHILIGNNVPVSHIPVSHIPVSNIPIVQSDRGGQVTYHGPGQLILYPLINIRRRQLGVRELVTLLERLVVSWLATYHVNAYAKADAPGVYVQLCVEANTVETSTVKANTVETKIASLGLRIRRGCSFHGVGINLNMDLAPFKAINPCGYAGLQMSQLSDFIPEPMPQMQQMKQELCELLAASLNHSPLLLSKEPLSILSR